ncbi:MAG: glutamine--fructose-6-phosphate transaminase (isomerizing) [Myxococcales bacterium]|nr:glutamine--fructose-6-phosphate transaminase (isomerizing) [Myxococcales bacterium]
MCGIVGYVGPRDGVPIALGGLQRLAYRGYDSAGLAVAGRSGLKVIKTRGKLVDLERKLGARFKGSPIIGHTRWATHGQPNDDNAHPHLDESGRIAIVHNGIIENAAALRERLQASGATLASQTDSEVLAHLIAASDASDLEGAVREVLGVVEGTYGLLVLSADQPDRIVVARMGSPVVLGVGDREMFVASDVAALVRYTQRVVYLDDGETASVQARGFQTHTLDAHPTEKETFAVHWGGDAYERGSYEHYMHKEIHEQPQAVERALRGRIDARFDTVQLGGIDLSARDVLGTRRIKILGCGSGYYAGLSGAHLIESLARVPADAEPASEFRYRNPVIEPDTLYIAVSQSGETFDTLAAVHEIKRKGGRVLGIVNVVGSTIARACDGGIYVHAGPEVSVTSTKTFTSTLVTFALLSLHIGRIRDLGPRDGRRLIDAMRALPEQIARILEAEAELADLARRYSEYEHAFFVGRANGYPAALEGAQKLKEVSYLHAEAYPAAELKHGPLALVSSQTPTVAIVPSDHLFDKNLSTLHELRARKGPIVAVGHGDPRLEGICEDAIGVPRSEPELDPVLLGIPLQLLAYHCAVALGRDVDQPRNLAKSVTVE